MTGPATAGIRTVALALSVPMVGREGLPATQALRTSGLAAHVEDKPEEEPATASQIDPPKEPNRSKKEEGVGGESGEENPTEE
jgi:hypothetical protein